MTPDPRQNRGGRFAWLLASLIALLVVVPFAQAMLTPLPWIRLLSSAVLVAALYALRRNPWVVTIGLGLAAPAFAASWASNFFQAPSLFFADLLLTGAFLSLTTVFVFLEVLREQRVTPDTVLGGISVYLLLGVVWNMAYSAAEFAVPGSLHGLPIVQVPESVEARRYPELLYFSFVTLTTLGYGDIVPATLVTRTLAATEALTGQLYVAVFVARLVGLHLAQRSDP